MRLNPFDLLGDYHTVTTELLDLVPHSKLGDLKDRVQRLNDSRTQLAMSSGRGGHWKRYRESQEFEVEIRGEGTKVVKGVETVAAMLGWKLSTFRTKFALSKGFLRMTRQVEGVEQLITVTKHVAR